MLLKNSGTNISRINEIALPGFPTEGVRVVILQISQYLTLHWIVPFGAHRVNGSAGSDFCRSDNNKIRNRKCPLKYLEAV